MSAKQQSGCPRMISGVVRLELNIDYGKKIFVLLIRGIATTIIGGLNA
jgi:hypothetical protein